MAIPFFEKEEINFLGQWGNTIYKPLDKIHLASYKRISSKLWQPTRYWADQLCSKLPFLSVKGKADWKESAGHSKFRFKHYTWFRLYHNDFPNPDFFFTVGVDGREQSLIIKIDYQRERPKLLNEKQIAFLERTVLRDGEGPYWTAVPISDFKKYTWSELIVYSVSFVNKHISLFSKLYHELQSLAVEDRIARITWNTNGWIMPSGPLGKSRHGDSHEAKYGYGHEEWLFDTSKIVDGYHYAFLEPIRKQQKAFANRFFNIWLYTIDGETKKRFFVGKIKNLEVLNDELAVVIKKKYVQNSWIEEMEQQLILSGANAKGFSNWKGVDLFNVRFRFDSIDYTDPNIELPAGHEIYEQSRYVFGFYKDEYQITSEEEEDNFIFNGDSGTGDDNGNGAPKTKTHTRPPKAIQITYLHDKISKSLTAHLKKIYGKTNVKREHRAGYGGNKIDIVVDDNGKYKFYEIKTYTSIRTSIREALGQLLEYNCWPRKKKASELIIVTQPHGQDNLAREYIRHIAETYRIPLSYQSYDWQKDELLK